MASVPIPYPPSTLFSQLANQMSYVKEVDVIVKVYKANFHKRYMNMILVSVTYASFYMLTLGFRSIPVY